MRFAAVTLLASAAFVAAQSSCDAQNILDACKVQYENRIKACAGNDWKCLCEEYTNLDTCYNNCPNSNERPPVKNQVTQFCLAADQQKSRDSSSLATVSTTQTQAQASQTAATTAASKTGTQAPTGTGSKTSSATGAEKTGAAASLAIPAGGLAAALALAGLL